MAGGHTLVPLRLIPERASPHESRPTPGQILRPFQLEVETVHHPTRTAGTRDAVEDELSPGRLKCTGRPKGMEWPYPDVSRQ
jgi:hypothetical protein